MIRPGFHYKAYRPKNVSGAKTVFDVGHKDKDGNMHYIGVMCDEIELIDKEEVTVLEITGFDQRFYTDKQDIKHEHVTLFCKVVRKDAQKPQKEARIDTKEEDFNIGPLMDISSDDLPF